MEGAQPPRPCSRHLWETLVSQVPSNLEELKIGAIERDITSKETFLFYETFPWEGRGKESSMLSAIQILTFGKIFTFLERFFHCS